MLFGLHDSGGALFGRLLARLEVSQLFIELDLDAFFDLGLLQLEFLDNLAEASLDFRQLFLFHRLCFRCEGAKLVDLHLGLPQGRSEHTLKVQHRLAEILTRRGDIDDLVVFARVLLEDAGLADADVAEFAVERDGLVHVPGAWLDVLSFLERLLLIVGDGDVDFGQTFLLLHVI